MLIVLRIEINESIKNKMNSKITQTNILTLNKGINKRNKSARPEGGGGTSS